jgi:FkbM family methyltransferase
MLGFLRSTQLPNGKRVYCLGTDGEAVSTFHQVEDYFKHGITVKPGDVIIDIGANIGLFSLKVFERCQGKAQVYAFEPLPQTHKALSRNVSTHACKTVQAFQLGMSDKPGSMSFRYFPNSSVSSTAYPSFNLSAERERLLEGFECDPILAHYRWVTSLPLWLSKPFLNLAVYAINFGYQVNCQVTTVSDFLHTKNLGTIDLLKIDAESSELNVLRGIKPHDWPKIQQIVIELHHGNRDLPLVVDLLKQHGFNNLNTEYELGIENNDLLTVYAVR